ncbi:hypothetical protein [Nocardioides jejuensis]|uniref:Uncharacterized protein n=1 Tax=Nocardioides jejuensis TaxID=2502782 RepID=A0A4R1BWZ4_9ACTN|nr:hypothetical protein [Nocardioides jejuensis]TCJ21916.1 hypothetical protein EPD65_14120 [Nocardioides jejuensis]
MKMSPESIALACFTFVTVVLLGGWQQIAMLASSSGLLPEGYGNLHTVLIAVAVDLPVALAMAAATRVGSVAESSWGRAFAQATVPLGFLALLASIVFVLGTISGHSNGVFFPRL